MRRRKFLSGLGLAFAAGVARAEESIDIQAFDEAWRIIRDRHPDPKINGLDWTQVRSELRPSAASSRDEVRSAIRAMLERLRQSHFALIPGEISNLLGSDDGRLPGMDVTGIEVRILDHRAIVSSVQPGFPSDAAGVRSGWAVRRIRNFHVEPALEKIASADLSEYARNTLAMRSISQKLRGSEGETVQVEFGDAADRPVSLNLGFVKPPGKPAKFGLLPPVYVSLKTSTFEDSIGLAALNVFFDPERILNEFGDALRSWKKYDGVVLDLRGNPGGIGGMAMGIAGWFVRDESAYLGTMIMRGGQLKFSINPRVEAFSGPLAILVDRLSASTSEILANGLQDLGRARIFGERTAGAALPSNLQKLVNGDLLQFAFASYVSASGKLLEGAGVEPDVHIPLARPALIAGKDEPLDAAIRWIRENKEKKA
jgi:carboxyl-terminal processing protease